MSEDNISNEFIKALNQRNRKKLLKVLNNLYISNKVPKTWKEGTLTTIYKNKGTKGFPGNDRGITVSSSMVKLMEKLIQTRMVRKVNITECQGG